MTMPMWHVVTDFFFDRSTNHHLFRDLTSWFMHLRSCKTGWENNSLCKNPSENQCDLINGTPLLWTFHTLSHTFEAFRLHLACLSFMSFGCEGKDKCSDGWYGLQVISQSFSQCNTYIPMLRNLLKTTSWIGLGETDINIDIIDCRDDYWSFHKMVTQLEFWYICYNQQCAYNVKIGKSKY